MAKIASPSDTHAPLIIALHWLTAAAIAASVPVALLESYVEGHLLKHSLLALHRSLGVLVLGAVLLRLLVRHRHRERRPDHGLPAHLSLPSALSHVAMYLLLLATPLLGWLQSGAAGQDLRLFGLLPLPALLGMDLDLADTLADYHHWAAWSLIALVGAHTVAALWHHYQRRDGVLRSMLPLKPLVAATESSRSE